MAVGEVRSRDLPPDPLILPAHLDKDATTISPSEQMTLLIESDHAAGEILVSVLAAAAGAEVLATYHGQARDGPRRIGASVAEALLLTRRRDSAQATDRGTKQILVVAAFAGLLAGWAIAHVSALRTYANTWSTLAIGASIALAGIGLRSWSVWTLGRHFRREVTIDTDQRVITTGPYRWVRHPAYAGNLLTYAGFGLALGSWASAAVALTAAFLGLLPRIKLEERTLERAFGPSYVDYKRARARLIPHVWEQIHQRFVASSVRVAAASPTGIPTQQVLRQQARCGGVYLSTSGRKRARAQTRFPAPGSADNLRAPCPHGAQHPWFASESTTQIGVLITPHLRGFRHDQEGVFDDRAGTFGGR